NSLMPRVVHPILIIGKTRSTNVRWLGRGLSSPSARTSVTCDTACGTARAAFTPALRTRERPLTATARTGGRRNITDRRRHWWRKRLLARTLSNQGLNPGNNARREEAPLMQVTTTERSERPLELFLLLKRITLKGLKIRLNLRGEGAHRGLQITTTSHPTRS